MRLEAGKPRCVVVREKSRRATEQTLPADNLSLSQLMSHLHSSSWFSAWKVTFRHGLSLAYSLTLAACHPQCTHAPLTLQKCVHSSFTAIQNTLHPGLFFAAVASRYISDQCMRTYSMFFPGTHTCKALSVGRYGWSWGMRLARWNGRCMIWFGWITD